MKQKQLAAALWAAALIFLLAAIVLFWSVRTEITVQNTAQTSEYLARAEQGIYLVPFRLHTATSEQLQQIPGVGPVLAERILDFLRENGPIEQFAQLDAVKGVGPVLLERIAQYTTLT